MFCQKSSILPQKSPISSQKSPAVHGALWYKARTGSSIFQIARQRMVCVLCRNSPILPQKCLFSCKRALSSRKRALVQYGANWHQYMPNNAGENDMCILSKEPQVQSKELQVLLYQKRPNKLNGPYECHELNTTHCSMSNSAGENGMCILSKKLYHAGNDT